MGQVPSTALFEKELKEHQNINYSSLRWAREAQGIKTGNIKLDSIWTKFQSYRVYSESKEYYRYNSNGQFVEEIVRDFNSKTEKWINKQKTELIYDTINSITTKNQYLWDTLNGWFMYDISTQQIDLINKKIIGKQWKMQPNKVIINISETYYNSDGLDSASLLYFNLDSNSQTFRFRREESYLYNKHLKIIELNSAVFDNISNKLQYTYKTIYSYSNDSLLSKQVFYSWDSTSLKWSPYSKYTYKYDSNGNLLETSHYSKDANSWIKTWKSKYVYDINSNRTFEMFYWKNIGNNLWEPTYKWEQVYDNNYELEDLILPQAPMFETGYELSSNKHIVSNRKHYEYSNGSWKKYDAHTFYYSKLNNVKETIYYEADIRVYPNPTSDYIMIELKNSFKNNILYIYDDQGRMVIQHNLSDDKKIPVYFLSQGEYLFSVKSENKVFTGKFIILR